MPAAAASAAPFNALAAIFPHLHLVALGTPIDFDAAVDERDHGLRLCAARNTVDWPRSASGGDLSCTALHRPGDCAAEAAKAADHGRRRIARAAIHIIAQIVRANGLDDRIV